MNCWPQRLRSGSDGLRINDLFGRTARPRPRPPTPRYPVLVVLRASGNPESEPDLGWDATAGRPVDVLAVAEIM